MRWFSSFWFHRKKLLILKRRPKMLRNELSILWVWTFVQFSLGIPICFTKNNTIWLYIQAFSCSLLFLLFLGITVSRYWLLFYMIHQSSALSDGEWKDIIN